MGSVPNHERSSPEGPSNTQRKRELLTREIEAAAKAAALSRGLPWELLALCEYGWQYVARPGVIGSWREYDRSQGQLFPHPAYIRKELLRHAEALRERKEQGIRSSLPAELSPLLEKSVSAAYRAYSKDEWKDLITKLDHSDLRPLLLYLRDNKEALTPDRDSWIKYAAVYDAAGRRSMKLLFSQGEWVSTPISDPLWAAVWWELSRRRTREGIPRPSKRRSWMEMASDRAVAESLGYNPDNMHKQVAKWRKRMKDVPFERFVEKFGGGWTDYLQWVRDPNLYKKIQSLRKKRGE
jgi:hypothetical protein